MTPSLIHHEGRPGILFVAPHGHAPLEAALHLIEEDPAVRSEFADRVADWHDLGTLEALLAAVARSGHPGLTPTLPRGMIDLNRGWRGRVEERETLFGKGAVDGWVRAHLRTESVLDELQSWYRSAMRQIREAASSARLLVEVHSYGDLGSTYDRHTGGRPMLRAESSVVHGSPWATAFPVGLARLIPADLRGTPRALEAAVGEALDAVQIELGPSPYPMLLPWNVSARFLAERWFLWLMRAGHLPEVTAHRLADLAWIDEQHDAFDPEDFPGVQALERTLGEWSYEGAALSAAFRKEDGSATLGMELRIDLRDRATAFGEAISDAAVAWYQRARR